MTPVDAVLRGVAAVCVITGALVVAAGPDFPRPATADATQQVAADSLQRRAESRDYTFLLTSPETRLPGRWCGGTIPYHLDLTQAVRAGLDPGAEAARWAAVMQRWAEASGGYYRFEYAGTRDLRVDSQGELDLDSIEPGSIGISYVHDDPTTGEAAYRAAAVVGRTAGNGGLQVTSNAEVPGGMLVGDRGFVMIDADDAAELSPTGLREALYQHESGHALGLGHVPSGDSIMNGTLSERRLTLTDGDRAGLRALIEMPCAKP